ncbi:TPA: metallophosphoesterase [Clostridioides difficile]|uniref:metallophosphoesterase family protein n=1 Tax=Clostridioides difficile TaxID=1496 RepID=UPI001C15F43A|nr:metallophosphoesterase [Clostridioides difficile]MCF2714162.1 metallophosphoesterase [Clostridioides difficile]HBF6521665.1 metallophosphoesterase [Clostridioides difficile]HBG3320084.1 metallophosphoesterase [Clostridioides difficile]HBG3505702.1 metallophosphoesterase [Clostridioides difficile]HBG3507364.1 metallophosphoesterase [Clostridioides difficile]
MSKQLNWVHLSDIHFTYKDYCTNTMRDLLLKYLKSLSSDKIFDFIVITGDIVFQGAKYDNDLINFINKILSALNLTKSELFIVPGNHDLKRDKMTSLALENLAREKGLKASIDKELEDGFKKRQRAYFTFLKNVTDNSYTNTKLHTVKSLDKCNLIHLNTAWSCGNRYEEGNLRIGLSRLTEVLKEVEGSEKINIAIGHHTIECFHESERDKIINRFVDQDVDIYLAGHVHKPKYHFEANNNRVIPMFVCGSGMVQDFGTNNFIVGSIDLETKQGKITYHSWNNDLEKWDVDSNVGRQVCKGDQKFDIDRLKKKDNISNILEKEYIDTDLDENEFKEFLIEFHSQFKYNGSQEFNQIEVDIKEKFVNMKCINSVEKEFLKFSAKFPIVNQIMNNPLYLDGEAKLIIPSVIVTEYQKVFDDYPTGTKIIEAMVDNMYNQYKNMLKYPKVKLCIYLKIMVYWSIQECDIFNDFK